MESLTKENFWNELAEKYPAQMKKFCDWIDEYKKRINWNELFNKFYSTNGSAVPEIMNVPKYHDLPVAMQIGIFFQFTVEQEQNYLLDDAPRTMEAFVFCIKEWFIYNKELS